MDDAQIYTVRKDVRLRATIWIWGLSIPLFFLCIPIIALTETGILVPLFVLGSAAIGTASVWFFHSRTASTISSEVTSLQCRVANLEAIAGCDELDSRFKSLDQKN